MADLPTGFRIRQATRADHVALKDITLKTGDSGQDGTHLQDDPDILGLVHTVPYQVYAPDFAFVLEDATGVCGYVLGTPDTLAFDDWMEAVWYPPLRARLTNPGPDPAEWRQSDLVRWRVFAPRQMPLVDVSRYPAQGHIDLLPRARGRGLGRAMMERLIEAMEQAKLPGVFLEVSHQNSVAQAFYRHIGFRDLVSSPDALFMGKSLTRTSEP